MTKKRTYQDPHAAREASRYEHPVPSRELILKVLEDQGRPLATKELLKLLKIRDDASREAFGFRLKAMLRDGQLLENRAGRLGLVEQMDLIAGKIDAHRDGYGFVIPDKGGEDLFLPPRQMQKVMNGDRVLVSEKENTFSGRREARIIEITERAMTHLVGRFHLEGHSCWLESDSKRLRQQAMIRDLGGFKPVEGDFLRAVITDYPDKHQPMIVKLVEAVATPDDAGMEVEVALRHFDLPFEWPDAVTAEASAIPDSVADKDTKGRYDLRDLPLVTIDGEDARDFDDAIYVAKRPRGGWRLIVAIADVSHYVRPNSPLDHEAHQRGTSIYFPSRVIPMLPEKLSNGLCSLNPEVDRLCLCCDMNISTKGRISGYVFREGIMRSHNRLTYTQVGALLEAPESETALQLKSELSAPVQTQLHAFHALYLALRQRREDRGAIDFESRDTCIIFNEQMKIKAIVPAERNVAHTMIEEAMLAANVCAARLLNKQKLPALYRNHDAPNAEKLAGLQTFLGPLGLSLDWDGDSDPKPAVFQALSEQLADRPDRNLIQLVMLRTLKQARYEAECKGHFGLAYGYYTHFTSPIRRYPDLLVHRALRYLIRQDECKQVENTNSLPLIPKTDILPFTQQQMVELGEHCSMTERRAEEASRDVEQWLKCQFMEERLGEVFPGTISGVTGFGLFVQIDDLLIDGLLHIATLGDDYFRFDPQMQLLQGEASGYQYRLGDRVEVQLAAVHTEERKIDLQLESHQPAKPPKKRGRHNTARTGRGQYQTRKASPTGKKTNSRQKRRRR